MRTSSVTTFLWTLTLLVSLPDAAALADQAADEAAIRENAAKYVELYNRRDSKGMAEMWSPDAVYTEAATGESVVGREEIAKQLDYVFAGSEDAKLKVDVESIDFVSPNVAIEKGLAEVSYSKSPTEKTEYTAVSVRRDGKWLLDRVTDIDVDEKKDEPPPSNYEHLKELEWMIGTWIDDDGEAAIETECEWTKNRNFMTRSFAMMIGDEVQKSGMQIVGWDPAAKQIRSWVFDSDGAYSEGKWTRKGEKWVIQQTGVLHDGAKTSATNIFTRLDDDSFTFQSIDREANGEVMPNFDEVLIVRKQEEE
jgi:uncharacterized protein (TIGR02246 family)